MFTVNLINFNYFITINLILKQITFKSCDFCCYFVPNSETNKSGKKR